MRASELRLALAEEFGERAPTLMGDLVLGRLGSRTGDEALDAGVPARDVWAALCEAQDVPVDRRHGRGMRRPPE